MKENPRPYSVAELNGVTFEGIDPGRVEATIADYKDASMAASRLIGVLLRIRFIGENTRAGEPLTDRQGLAFRRVIRMTNDAQQGP